MNEREVIVRNKPDHPVNVKLPDKKEYYITFETFNPGQTNFVPSDCNSISFRNLGTDVVYINGSVPLTQNDFISIPGEITELDRTVYSYRFAGATNSQLLLVVRKVYIV